MLFYRLEGTIKDIENMAITPIEIMLRDIGTASTTGFVYDRECVNYMMKNEHLEEDGIYHGMIHSHHSMNVFFSGTDVDELQDNAEAHNFYLSLVINNFMEMVAKVVFVGTSTHPKVYTCTDELGEAYEFEIENSEKALMVYDCKIEQPEEEIVVDQQFKQTLQEVRMKINKRNEEEAKKKAAAIAAKTGTNQHGLKSIGGNGGYGQHGVTQGYGGPQQNFHEGNKQEQEDTQEIAYYEDFFAYCLNGGAHTNLTEDALVLQIDKEKTGDIVCSMVMDNYANYYQHYFEVDTYGMDSEDFEDCIDEFIYFCEGGAEQGMKWMGKLGEGLNQIKIKFEQLNLNQKVNEHSEVR